MNWRPDDWVNPFPKSLANPEYDRDARYIFEAGASAMLAALLEWLKEPCDKQEHSRLTYKYESYGNRSDCPECMASLREVGQ